MKPGDLVRVDWHDLPKGMIAVIIQCPNEDRAPATLDLPVGFYSILCGDEPRYMHSDFMELVDESR